ncbi:MAG: NUDIX hydrolase [Longimicrobiales bacterium]
MSGTPDKGRENPAAHWQLQTEPIADFEIFRVVRKRGQSPRNGQPVVFHALDLKDWVQVIPRTADGRLIMVEQFRPGAEVATLEFPAGIIDDGEDPLRAGLRELEEETGYQARRSTLLGSVFANPAIQTNRLHLVLAENCEATGSVQQDDGEDVRARLVAEDELKALMLAGTINHALVLAAWQLYELWRVQRAASRT